MRRLDCDGRDVTDLPGLWSDDDRVIYTPDEAMAMLPAGERIRQQCRISPDESSDWNPGLTS